MTDSQKVAFDQYLHHSRVLDESGLKEFYADGDFGLLCSNRAVLAEANLDDQQDSQLKSADSRLASVFDGATLQKYVDAFPNLPVRSWWG